MNRLANKFITRVFGTRYTRSVNGAEYLVHSETIPFVPTALKHTLNTTKHLRLPRKPPGSPVAKSKLFRVPEIIELPPEEQAELDRLNHNYSVVLRSIREHLKLAYPEIVEVKTSLWNTPEEEQEHLQLLAENRAENERVGKLREALNEVELNKDLQEAMDLKLAKLESEKVVMEQAKEKIKLYEKLSEEYIKLEELDDYILKAMENTVNYNYYLDPSGTLKS